MQRKNSILKHRNAMAMIMAIIVIIVLTTIMAFSLRLTSQTTKRTKDIYLYEQAALYAKSATEYALVKIANASPCSYTDDNFTIDGIYNVSIKARYIYTNASTICPANANYFDVHTPEQNGSVLLDVAVDINSTAITPEPIRYFRRTLQKL